MQTSTVADLAAHPLKTFLEHGIRASINTDDQRAGSGYHSRIYRCRASCWVIPRANPPGRHSTVWKWLSSAQRKKRALREKVAAK
ncbi:hypothetical protein ACLK1Z_09530 [Escherichia coli]